jgi:hypothetical protein
MTISRMLVLAAITHRRLEAVLHRLPPEPCRGRPWSSSLRRRVLITCAALRTNLTIRELAASFAISKSTAHRIIASLVPKLAALLEETRPRDRRESWVVDGTLIPTRDHDTAARSKNYRWSCNAQILVRRRDLKVVATSAGGPGTTIQSTTAVPSSRRDANSMGASRGWWLPRRAPSSSPHGFTAIESYVTVPGDDIDEGEQESSTRSPGSRIGVSCVTIDGADAGSRRRFRLSHSFTISRSICGTPLSHDRSVGRSRSSIASR